MKKIIFIILLNIYAFADDYKLIGSSLLEYSIFKIDVYEISYFQSLKSEKIQLDYKIDVEKKHSLKGWEVGFKNYIDKDTKFKEKISWILENTIDFKKGDQLVIERNNTKVTFKKNGVVYATTTNPLIAKIIYKPWIGEHPIDEKIKRELIPMKNQKSEL
jgi:hypothetical protein